LDFQVYLNRQNTEGLRACIIHAPRLSGKTHFARRIVETRHDAYLFDLQKFFLENPGLPPVHQVGLDELWEILLKIETDKNVIVVDHPDFLFNTWSRQEKVGFVNFIRVQLRSPGDTLKTFVIVMQSDSQMTQAQFQNSHGEARVLKLSEFDAL